MFYLVKILSEKKTLVGFSMHVIPWCHKLYNLQTYILLTWTTTWFEAFGEFVYLNIYGQSG